MRYLKYIKEEFGMEVSGTAASTILMDYDAFKLNGSSSRDDEKEEENEQDSESIEVEAQGINKKQIG